MRVLWISSTPALGASHLGAPLKIGGGWIASLEAGVKEQEELDLSIAFPWDTQGIRKIEVGRHAYFPFPRFPRGGRLRRWGIDFSCRIEPNSEVEHLERVVALSEPDLIHVWGTEAFFGLIAEHTQRPVLFEIQGLRTPCSEAYCSGLSKTDLLRFGSAKRLLSGRSLLHTYYRYCRTAVRERRVLAPARFVSGRTRWDRLLCEALAPRARYFHCDRMLRPAFYEKQWVSSPRKSTKLRIVTTARGNAYKGIEVVSRCASILDGLLPGRFEWSIVGIRPGEEIHRIVERKLGVSFAHQNIRLVGRLSSENVARQLLDSDVYVLSSRIENSPNGLSEAMMVGLPVIATTAGGTPSLLENEKEGLLIPPGDPWAMAGAIRRLAEDPDLARRLGVDARYRAQNRHDPERVVSSLLDIYRQVLADHREADQQTEASKG